VANPDDSRSFSPSTLPPPSSPLQVDDEGVGVVERGGGVMACFKQY